MLTYVEENDVNRERLGRRGFDVNARSDETSAAGYTYVAQLLSHDINLEETSVLGKPIDPSSIPNINTPFVDLDTIYDFAGTKVGNLEYALDGDKFNISQTPGGLQRDFPRDSAGAAITLDQRNDQNRILSQFTVSLMTLHNAFVDEGMPFEEARRQTISEWQAVVLSDMLPSLLDPGVLEAVAGNDRKLYKDYLKAQSVMPVEFATAAYRVFHSRINSLYVVNANTTARLFDIGDLGIANESHLGGGLPLPDDLVIEWTHFFGPDAQSSRILDPFYSQPIISGSPSVSLGRLRVQSESSAGATTARSSVQNLTVSVPSASTSQRWRAKSVLTSRCLICSGPNPRTSGWSDVRKLHKRDHRNLRTRQAPPGMRQRVRAPWGRVRFVYNLRRHRSCVPRIPARLGHPSALVSRARVS